VAEEILRTASVTYAAGKAIYVDAGQAAGLEVGELVRVLRGGEPVGELRVVASSAKRSLCEVTGAFEALAGDVVEFNGVAPSETAAEPSVSVEAPRPAPRPGRSNRGWLRSQGIRGRVGLRYLSVENSGVDATIRQPAVDLRMEGQSLFGSDVDVSIDARARRSTRTSGDDSEREGRTRVYRLLGAWDSEPFRVVGGRQASTSLSAVGIFDGLSAELGRDRWSGGAFVGTQPDAENFGYSTDIREHGAWLTRRSGVPSTWEVTGGYVGSYQGSTINRENFVLQGRVFLPRGSLFVLQEADLHRGWKAKAEGGGLAWTSSYASGRYRAFERLWIDAGFDTRRNVRLYRDRVTPETEFDDTYRQGYWGGLRYELGPTTRATLGFRRTTGGSAEAANSATVTVRATRPRWSDSSLGFRTTVFDNRASRGRLHSLSAGVEVLRAHVEVTGGVRAETSRLGLAEDSDAQWVSIELDRQIARPWFVLMSWDRDTGSVPGDDTTQLHLSLLYRF
jgi:hypothetical protein